MKKIKILIVLLLISTLCSAQEGDNENPPIEISKLQHSFQYYGLPLQAKIGWLYRYNDFSIFPNAGIKFDVNGKPEIGISAGLSVRKGIFSWSANVFYNLLPFTVTNPLEDQQVSVGTNFSVAFSGGSISFPSAVGITTSSSTVATTLSQGIGFNLFLLDVGFFKSTASALFSIQSIPAARFFSYRVRLNVPATFSLYYVDIALMYQFLHSDELVFDSIKPSNHYSTGNKWSAVSGRTTFPSENTRYKTINSIELELRWYMLRHFIPYSNFFISAFSQVGWGLSDTQSVSLLYEYGMGLGYTLFDSAPFTFQVGLDKNFKPIFYLSVVSKIIH